MSGPKSFTRLLLRAAPLLNAPVAAIANAPGLSGIVGRNVALISYTGRRSGRAYSIPVAYRRSGDELEIAANMPDAKTWWRNFLGEGAALAVRLGRTDYTGHAVAQRGNTGRVTVRVTLATS